MTENTMPAESQRVAETAREHSLQKRGSVFCGGKMDLTFFFLLLGILATGLVMLFSASAPYASTYYGDSYHYIKRQLFFAVIGVIAMYVISTLNYHVLKKFAWVIYGASAVMLVAVLFLPEVVPGFKRWLGIGSFTFQPSEIAKFAVILVLALLISRNYEKMSDVKYDLKLFGILLVIVGLVALEKHVSATLLIALIGFAVIAAGGMNKKFMTFLIVAGVSIIAIGVFLAIAYPDSFGHVSDRINIWLHLWDYDKDLTHQTRQSLMAIGSGGITGQGIGQSTQKYLWVPEPQNDFIFSIVCEELGLFGALLIIIAFALLLWRGLIIAMRAPDKFGALLTLGIIFQVGLQTALNMLVVTNTIPNTGISLPFFSYGGSSLMMLLAQMGIVLGVSRQAKMQKI